MYGPGQPYTDDLPLQTTAYATTLSPAQLRYACFIRNGRLKTFSAFAGPAYVLAHLCDTHPACSKVLKCTYRQTHTAQAQPQCTATCRQRTLSARLASLYPTCRHLPDSLLYLFCIMYPCIQTRTQNAAPAKGAGRGNSRGPGRACSHHLHVCVCTRTCKYV